LFYTFSRMADVINFPVTIVYTICSTIFKISTLAVGMTIVYLGYKLFVKNVVTEAGDFEGQFKDYKVTLKKAVPGTYFILLGSAIIIFVVHIGIHFKSKQTKNSTPTSQNIANEDSLNIDPEPPEPTN
jgi:hypothetical protein